MTMKKKMITLLMAGLLAISVCVPVLAMESEEDTAGNVLASGDLVTLPTSPFHSAFAAGNTIDIGNAECEGTVAAAGQQINAAGASIGESLYVAGNGITLNNVDIQGNIFAAGNTISIIGNSEANGIYAVGQSITFAGETNALCAAANRVSVSGTIHGDVNIEAEDIEIDEDTIILGKLNITSTNEPEIPDTAEIGEYNFNEASKAELEAEKASTAAGIGSKILNKIGTCFYWIVAMAAFGMLLCWLFDKHLESAKEYIKNRTSAMVITGIVGWICIPIAALILCCTCIFAPIGGLLILAYILLLCSGLAFAGASLSRLVFPKMNVYLAALIGIAVLEAFRMVPVLGPVVGIAADMYLIAYVIQVIWLNRMKKKAA